MENPNDSRDGNIEESFISHLVELRSRLIRVVALVGLLFIGFAFYGRELYALTARPLLAVLRPLGGEMIVTDVAGNFLVPTKVALMAAFLVSLPYVLYQLWAFVAPGLYAHEKRFALPLLVVSVLLFFAGMAFAYFQVFPTVFFFMSKLTPEGVAWMTDVDKYLSFVLTVVMAFGLAFEVPVAVVLLVKAGLASLEKLRAIRAYVIVAAFVVGAVFTPPDIISQFMLAIPVCLLYEAGLLAARFIRPPEPADAGLMSEAELDAALQASGIKSEEPARAAGLTYPAG
ncbi:MAG: twin-arginine translocase subunit TatC [Zoogloeaceae bacterium]|jgi:sec-independent protein translocase protein TatC|nr:twin-arginine translocase subunit TatC [Zoogloeaceae bacterium]